MSALWPEHIDVDDAILDAAEECFSQNAVADTTIEDIAAQAGVSRVTVYRRIGSRDELIVLVLLRITDRFLAILRPRLLAEPSADDALVLLVRETIRAVRRDDLRLLFSSAGRGAVGAPIEGALVSLSHRFGRIVGLIADQFPSQLRPDIDQNECGEWILRIIVSWVTFERADRPRSAETDDETERWIRTFVLPGILADRTVTNRRR
ncbi:MAG: TetR/AcrR family transcriptional regulator [Actinobacteria bacterium]|nr:MAG: TetR/AcrR family transcriptional regulator [Actinomycetota bacterium]